MRYAESKLSLPAKPYKWSPQLRNAGVLLRYWKLRMRECKHGEDYSMKFLNLETRIQLCDPNFRLPHKGIPLPLADIRRELNQASRHLRQTQKQATEIRFQSYQDLLEGYENEGSSESNWKATVVRRTMASETCRRLFSNIRTIVKPSETSVLSTIQIPRCDLLGEVLINL